MTAGEDDLQLLLRHMQPELSREEFGFVSCEPERAKQLQAVSFCQIVEAEGVTLVVELGEADRLGLQSSFRCRRITLRVHSSLDAVGFLAAISTALAKANISCNVVSGYYHDHLLVQSDDADQAMQVLKRLQAGASKPHDR